MSVLSEDGRLRRRGGLLVVCALLLVALAGAARAGADIFEIQQDQFTIEGTHGYEITVSAFPGGRPFVTLEARRGNARVEYTAHGTVTEEEINAKFGSLGSIAMRFEPSGQAHEAIDYCDSTHPTVAVDLGAFVGTFSFHGERGYTAATATRVEGGVGDTNALPGSVQNKECEGVTTGQQTRDAEFTDLEAASPKAGLNFDVFAATSVEGSENVPPTTSRIYLAAGSFAKEAGMTIARSISAGAPRTDFTFDPALDQASIKPPAPFSGTAKLRTTATGASTWTGTLKAPIPGVGTVSLAGPGFHAKLHHSQGTIIG